MIWKILNSNNVDYGAEWVWNVTVFFGGPCTMTVVALSLHLFLSWLSLQSKLIWYYSTLVWSQQSTASFPPLLGFPSDDCAPVHLLLYQQHSSADHTHLNTFCNILWEVKRSTESSCDNFHLQWFTLGFNLKQNSVFGTFMWVGFGVYFTGASSV